LEKGSSFDLRTHVRDPKNGRVIAVQPYTRKVSKDGGVRYIRDNTVYFENGEVDKDMTKDLQAQKKQTK